MKTLDSTLMESQGTILGYIRKKVGDPDLAEDILQDSLLKALRGAGELRGEEKILPWFYRIVNNAITDYYRHRLMKPKYLERYAAEIETSIEPEEITRLCACMNDLVSMLKPEYAVLIQELELNDGDPAQVAERLGITRNNLKVRRHRARTQLRERLEETCRTCAKHGCLDCSCGSHP